jgi:hypothetical protein
MPNQNFKYSLTHHGLVHSSNMVIFLHVSSAFTVVIISTVPPSSRLWSTIYIIIHLLLLLAQVTALFYTTSSMQYCSRTKISPNLRRNGWHQPPIASHARSASGQQETSWKSTISGGIRGRLWLAHWTARFIEHLWLPHVCCDSPTQHRQLRTPVLKVPNIPIFVKFKQVIIILGDLQPAHVQRY